MALSTLRSSTFAAHHFAALTLHGPAAVTPTPTPEIPAGGAFRMPRFRPLEEERVRRDYSVIARQTLAFAAYAETGLEPAPDRRVEIVGALHVRAAISKSVSAQDAIAFKADALTSYDSKARIARENEALLVFLTLED